MPDGTSARPPRGPGDDPFSPERTEQLNRAIDRAMLGGPVPVLSDPDLRDLVALAARLRDELPRDIPDPAFRDDLKRQLTRDRLEALPPLRPVHDVPAQRSRMSAFAALSAVAAVFVAVVSIGLVGVLLNRDDATGEADVAAQSTVTRELATTALGVASSVVDEPTGTPAEQVAMVTQPSGGVVAVATVRTAVVDDAMKPATEAVDSEASQTMLVQTATVAPQRTSEPQIGSLPSVELGTVEQGPIPSAEGASDGPDDGSSAVEFILNTELPDIASSAPVYRLAPPDVDPTELVEEIAGQLGIDGPVEVDTYNDYREFHVDSDDGRTFRWIPETGAFQYGSLDNSVDGDLTAAQATEALRDWLASTGYPVEQLGMTGDASAVQAGQWQVQLVFDALPQPGVGHPLGVRAFVNDEGTVLSATGYWLVAESQEEATLLTSEECWGAVQTGAGYWRDGGMASEGGELRVSAMAVSYVLTRDESGLVLQPVVQADGSFRTADGLSESQISVFIQATRSHS